MCRLLDYVRWRTSLIFYFGRDELWFEKGIILYFISVLNLTLYLSFLHLLLQNCSFQHHSLFICVESKIFNLVLRTRTFYNIVFDPTCGRRFWLNLDCLFSLLDLFSNFESQQHFELLLPLPITLIKAVDTEYDQNNSSWNSNSVSHKTARINFLGVQNGCKKTRKKKLFHFD